MLSKNASRLLRFGWHFRFCLVFALSLQRQARRSDFVPGDPVPGGTQNQPIEDSLEPRSLLPRLVVPPGGHWFRRSTGQYWQDPRSEQARYREERTVRVRLRSIRRCAHEIRCALLSRRHSLHHFRS